jgi:cobalt-zinc-cadmium efflux system membrane fusion protein
VLVVDDDEMIGNVLSRVLDREGYSVVLAKSPAEALELADEAAPNVALLDLCYPDGDGVQLASDLHARHAGLPLILMTAYPVRLTEQPELARAFARVLHKPIDINVLRRTVAFVLQREAAAGQAATSTPIPPSVPAEDRMEPISRPHDGQSAAAAVSPAPTHGHEPETAVGVPRLTAGSLAYVALFLVAVVGFAAFVLRIPIPMPWQQSAHAEGAAPAREPGAGDALKSVELVDSPPHTLMVPEEARKNLGITRGQGDLIAVAKPPTRSREMTLPGSTWLDPTRLYRIRARFAPARLVEIAQRHDLSDKGDRSEMRELRSGDRVKKGDLLGVFYSVDVGQKKNDLVDALYQLKLDERILEKAQKPYKEGAIPEVLMASFERNVNGDRNAIARALSNLRTWDIPEADIAAVYQESEEIAKRGGQRDRSKDELWPRVELRAPADGILVQRDIVKDEMIVDQTVNLFQIATTERLFVTANAPEDDLPTLLALTTSQRRWTVRTVGQLGKEGTEGRIDDISYLIDPNQHTAVIKGHIENPVDPDNPDGRIRAGQFVTATVQLPPPPDVVEVPADAVVDDGRQSVVFVETDAQKHLYTMRRVELTQRFDKTVFVRSKPFDKKEQPTKEEQELGLLLKEPLLPKDRILQTGVGELKAALLDKEESSTGRTGGKAE